MPEEIKGRLLKLADKGLLIDFSNIIKDGRAVEIPIYTIGKYLDMDEMYNGLRQHIGCAKYSARLIHKNKTWSIQYVEEK